MQPVLLGPFATVVVNQALHLERRAVTSDTVKSKAVVLKFGIDIVLISLTAVIRTEK